MRGLLIFLTLNFPFIMGISQTLISPAIVSNLSEEIMETSGLVNVNGEIWTHNDSGGADKLYQIDLTNGDVIRNVKIDNANNDDWEDLASDVTYIYIGDFGNNDGDRTNLKIYRISREELAENDEVEAEKIKFSYPDQTSWEINHNNHNFDCEAMICYQDHLYLFTKNWLDYHTKVYRLPNQPGTHVAEYLNTFDVECLITGAEILPNADNLILIGYNTNGGTFTWIFNDFESDNFFEGETTQFIWTLLTQAEGVCVDEDNSVYISSEEFENILDPMLYHFDFDNYITGHNETIETDNIIIFESNGNIMIRSTADELINGNLAIYNQSGTVVNQFHLQNNSHHSFSLNLTSGIYIAVLNSEKAGLTTKKIRL